MNHRQIEIFATVMKTGTASGAADLLGITQPAVSRAIAELERTIMFSLFNRVRGRLVPTPEARLFYCDVEASFRGLDTLRASAAWIRDQGAGEIRIATLSSFSSSLVPQAISLFRARHPETRVTLHVLWSRDVRDRVASGQFDIGLAADEVDTSGVHSELFANQRIICAIPRESQLCELDVITPSDLEDVPIIGYVPEDRARQHLEDAFAQAGITPNIILETIYASTVCCLVSNGLGVGFVSRHSTGGIDCTRLMLRPFEPAINSRVLLLRPLDRQKSQLVRDFIDCLLMCR